MIKKIIICLLFIAYGYSAEAQEIERKVKITHIDSTEYNYYIKGFFREKTKHKVLIISPREAVLIPSRKIQIHKKYLIRMSNYLNDTIIKKIPAKPSGTIMIEDHGYIIWDGKTDLPYKSSDIKSIYYYRKN